MRIASISLKISGFQVLNRLLNIEYSYFMSSKFVDDLGLLFGREEGGENCLYFEFLLWRVFSTSNQILTSIKGGKGKT